MAQVLNQLALTLFHFVSLATTTGLARTLVVPSPTWPRWLTPQQKSLPLFLMPQVEAPPAETRAPLVAALHALRRGHVRADRAVAELAVLVASPAQRASRRRAAGSRAHRRWTAVSTAARALALAGRDWAGDCTDGGWALADRGRDAPAPAGAARAIGVNRLAIRAMRATCAFMATSGIDSSSRTGNFSNIRHGSSQTSQGPDRDRRGPCRAVTAETHGVPSCPGRRSRRRRASEQAGFILPMPISSRTCANGSKPGRWRSTISLIRSWPCGGGFLKR